MKGNLKKYISDRIYQLPHYSLNFFAADLVAGLTVSFILIPQSLAYAQLAGLPPHYGLYAALLPPLVAIIFGSGRFLSTGPVAIDSLMTASVLALLPLTSSSEMISYAVFLAFLVGIIQLILGLFKMGGIVTFISHPVLIGFTNAAAIIIATSQLPKIFGISLENYRHHYETVYHFLIDAPKYTHWLSIFIALIAFLIIYIVRAVFPRFPAVLAAVVICTALAMYVSFDQKHIIPITMIASADLQEPITAYNKLLQKAKEKSNQKSQLMIARHNLLERNGTSLLVLEIDSRIAKLTFEKNELDYQIQSYRKLIRSANLVRVQDGAGSIFFYKSDTVSSYVHLGDIWHIIVPEGPIDTQSIAVTSGGQVVGDIPSGLPQLRAPDINIASVPSLFNGALIIALLGFMESVAIARSLAAKAGDKINPDKILLGQGLANIAGSFTQGYPVAGSFSRTAVNYNAGAKTRLAGIFTVMFVFLTLLFFTPLLYYLPYPVLAVIIITSVVGLMNFNKMKQIWQTNRSEGIIAVSTFVATLFFAPRLDQGIILGVLLSTGYYIYTRTRPRIVQLSGDSQNILHDCKLYKIKPCAHIAIIRFDGSLFFANAEYLESKIEGIVNTKVREIRAIILVADGINYIDYSGIETLIKLIDRHRHSNRQFIVTAMKSHIYSKIKSSPEFRRFDTSHFVVRERDAIQKIYQDAHINSAEGSCSLKGYAQMDNNYKNEALYKMSTE